MFSLFKKNKNKVEIPQWASFFNTSEYQKFISAIESYFYSQNITYTLGEGVIDVGPNDFGFSALGLVNVAQVCKQSELTDYKEVINEHFDALVRTFEFNKKFENSKHSYVQIEQYLGVRLYPIEYFDQIGRENIIGKSFSEDVFATLVFDLPDSISNIKPGETTNWNKSLDQLFDIGINNIKKNYQFEISLQEFDDFNIWLVEADHFFSPNILFELKDHPELIGPHGSLIGIPHRHAVIIYPIENIETVSAVNSLIPVINKMNNEGPGSLSPNLFWYHSGQFDVLPYQIEENGLRFYPPESFVELLNRLA